MTTPTLHHDFLPTLPSLLAHSNVPLIHRDLSWLQFNERVLAEARQSTNPLLERAKFLAITATNLDEFFMIRLASLSREIATLDKKEKVGAERLARIRDNILESVAKFGAKQTEAFELLAGELESFGVKLVRQVREGEAGHAVGKRIFTNEILPKLGAPEGFSMGVLSQLQNLQLAAIFESQNLWFRIPRTLPLVYKDELSEGGEVHFFFLDDLLQAHLSTEFRIPSAPGLVRVTRDGEISIDVPSSMAQELEALPDAVRAGLRARDKGRVVRLQYSGELSEQLLRKIAVSLRVLAPQVLPAAPTLCLGGLWAVFHQTPDRVKHGKGRELVHLNEQREGILPGPLRGLGELGKKKLERERVFELIRRQDVFFHQPYDSFDGFVQWLAAAAQDPQVESIDQTVYRMDADSPILEALKLAAKKKRVRVFVELRARFDELNNVLLADELRKAGAEVIYGSGKLKLHAKLCLVGRREEGLIRYYTHLSTGNYNVQTAHFYTDMALLTAHAEIGSDAKHFLDSIAQGAVPSAFKQLVIAPNRLHRRLIGLIDAETEAGKAGRKGRIVAKVNALVDAEVIERLYRASQAGVQVDLICRGACSAIPGVKGLSENIHVVSIVDRLLEHSRIYWFGDSKAMYLSSADWMPRNFFSRLEIAFPVLDPSVLRFLEEVVIRAYLGDSVRARELTPQGTWKKRTPASVRKWVQQLPGAEKDLRAQFYFQELAARDYTGTSLHER